MAMCPGVTDTALFNEAHRRTLRKEWGDEMARDIEKFFKQK